ncbi:MAG: response regulator transcription factor [Bacteroidales bacterium]|jgi:two-component system alkaline phosphatase synthesis response regulator PhoP
MEKILIVDDEPDILEFLKYNLIKEGFEVHTCTNGKDAIQIAKEIIPNLIILDVMMPEMDGIETCREIKQINILKNILVIFLSARSEDYSQIAGYDAGADDYITKPIKLRILISKIKALIKRVSSDEVKTNIIDFGEIKIDKENYIVIKKNKNISLPKKEFELLVFLASKPNRLFTRDEIMNRVWGTSTIVGERTLDVHVRKLREKLGDDVIKTIKGVGYKFEV